jgi:hypothetical protein
MHDAINGTSLAEGVRTVMGRLTGTELGAQTH